MNLPTICERDYIMNGAENEFTQKLCEIYNIFDIDVYEDVDMFSQMIANISIQEKDKVIIDDCHEKTEEIFNLISYNYNLSYGEKLTLLLNRMNSDVKTIIKLERK